MKIYVVAGVYCGLLNDLKVFTDKEKAKEARVKIGKEYGDHEEKGDVDLQTFETEPITKPFCQTTDGENILWVLLEEDAQNVAKKEFKTKLDTEELLQVQKKLGFGLECWYGVMETAVEAVLEERKKDNEAIDKED